MNAPCPFCHLLGGFHDEETHATIGIPADKIIPIKPEPTGCRNCGAPYDQPAIPPCRNPDHVS